MSKVIRLLKYLKWNSNKDHQLERIDLTSDANLGNFLGGKTAQTTAFEALHEGLNTDYDERLLDEEDWRVVISGKKLFTKEENGRLGSMYYNHPFTHDEIDLILEGIWSIKTIDNEQAKDLTERIKKELGDRFYEEEKRALFTDIFKEQESTAVDKEKVQNNLKIIKDAITSNKQIIFNLYSWYSGVGDKAGEVKLIPRIKNPNRVSPYRIVFHEGKYYLQANTEVHGDEVKEENKMSVWRVDLMDEIEIHKENSTPKEKVKNYPQKFGKLFKNEHISMSYDSPVRITMKISPGLDEERPLEERSLDYKFIRDWFTSYTFKGVDDKDYYGHIIEVTATKFAIVNWAFQYNQEVEILSPPHIRKDIQKKIEHLDKKYKLKN